MPKAKTELEHRFLGRLGRALILSGVSDYTQAFQTAHNEFTRHTEGGALVVRYIDTDILWFSPSRMMAQIGVEDWRTVSTVRHINNALQRHGWPWPRVNRSKGSVSAQLPNGQAIGFDRTLLARRDTAGGYHLTSDRLTDGSVNTIAC